MCTCIAIKCDFSLANYIKIIKIYCIMDYDIQKMEGQMKVNRVEMGN